MLVGQETWPPYDRPPLSKPFQLNGDETAARLAPDLPSEVCQKLGRTVVAIEPRAHQLRLDVGSILPWDCLLIATGTRPLFGAPDRLTARVYPAHAGQFKTDPRQAARLTSLLVIDGGPISLELAATAMKLDVSSTVVEAASRLMSRSLPSRQDHHG